MKARIAFLFLIISVSESWAQEIRPFYRGVRSQGMGGAGIGVVNDESALFVNPAGLGKIRGWMFVVANPEVEANYTGQSALITGNKYTAVMDPQQMLAVARANPNELLHFRGQILPAFVTANFGIGGYSANTMDAKYNSTTNLFEYFYRNDMGASVGYNFRIWDGRIKIGASGKLINRVEINKSDIDGSAADLKLSTLAKEGSGFGLDTGIILSGPWKYLPSLAVVAHDLGNTKFTGNGYTYPSAEKPDQQYQSIDASLSFFPIHGKRTRSSITAEYRDVQNVESKDIFRRIHAGYEFNYADIAYLRAGMNQRYWTAGFELSIGFVQFQAASYGEEIGTPTAPKEDRRYTFEMALRF